jgi:hypothetical protein
MPATCLLLFYAPDFVHSSQPWKIFVDSVLKLAAIPLENHNHIQSESLS